MSETFGKWNVNVVVGKLPQKVASAFSEVLGELLGAEYTPIAYLGEQLVNGTNHAVLAEQTLVNGKDTKNVVVVILNERGDSFTLSNIERVVETGAPLGGTVVDVKTDIPEEAKKVFDEALGSFIGSNVKPFALLATQQVKGTNYTFAAEVVTTAKEPDTKVVTVTINSLEKKMTFDDILVGN